jgi:hypothetical protein
MESMYSKLWVPHMSVHDDLIVGLSKQYFGGCWTQEVRTCWRMSSFTTHCKEAEAGDYEVTRQIGCSEL